MTEVVAEQCVICECDCVFSVVRVSLCACVHTVLPAACVCACVCVCVCVCVCDGVLMMQDAWKKTVTLQLQTLTFK